jgi:hypothetical protein
LTYCIGGKETQTAILKSQIDVAVSRLAPEMGIGLTHEFQIFYFCSKALELSVEGLPTHFWSVFDHVVENSFSLFRGPKDVRVVSTPMDLMLSYAQFVKEVGLKDEIDKVILQAQQLVMRQIMFVVNQFDHGRDVSPPQLVLLYGALLLQSHEAFFYRNFGLLKIIVEDRARAASANCQANSSKCPKLNCTGQMQPLPGHLIKIWQCSSCKEFATEWGSKICPKKYMSVIHQQSSNGYLYRPTGGYCSTCNHCLAPQTLKKKIYALKKCDKCSRQLETKCIGTSKVKWCSACTHWYIGSSVTVCVGSIADQHFESADSKPNYISGSFPKYSLVDEVVKPLPEAGACETLLPIPDSLEDQEHFGHLIWTFGRIMKMLRVEY